MPSIPAWPPSTEWFDAVLQASQPLSAIELASAAGVLKIG